eukprot:m.129371 g.129371  ORF g.129371 m.129371 type:complete len:110 (+) comp23637_c0_seq1:1619-1948(+)
MYYPFFFSPFFLSFISLICFFFTIFFSFSPFFYFSRFENANKNEFLLKRSTLCVLSLLSQRNHSRSHSSSPSFSSSLINAANGFLSNTTLATLGADAFRRWLFGVAVFV